MTRSALVRLAPLVGAAFLLGASVGGASPSPASPPPAEDGSVEEGISGPDQGSPPEPPPEGAAPTYRLYVANESSDNVMRVAFTPGEGAEVEKTIPVGIMPGDIDGAHGIAVAPSGDRWYVTIAHGTPYGSVWQFETGSDSLVARSELGLFPATMGVTPDGSFLFAVNFNLHGDMVPSDVSVVHTPTMTELARITTCLMPHGSRVSADGTKHYSACMHSDQVVEIDATRLEVSERFSVVPRRERTVALDNTGDGYHSGASIPAVANIEVRPELQRVCSPTWVEPGEGERADRFLYVACNKNQEVLEVSTERWEVTRRFPTGQGPYNLEVTRDGRLLAATLKGEQKVAFFDLETGKELARVATSEPVSHGVAASPDGRYLFVSNESVGSTKGTLDVFDLETLERIESVELGHQSGGIDFWEISGAGR